MKTNCHTLLRRQKNKETAVFIFVFRTLRENVVGVALDKDGFPFRFSRKICMLFATYPVGKEMRERKRWVKSFFPTFFFFLSVDINVSFRPQESDSLMEQFVGTNPVQYHAVSSPSSSSMEGSDQLNLQSGQEAVDEFLSSPSPIQRDDDPGGGGHDMSACYRQNVTTPQFLHQGYYVVRENEMTCLN